jgi:hypothetical protein
MDMKTSTVGAGVTDQTSPVGLPEWLSIPDPPAPKLSKEQRALSYSQYEAIFPRVLELLSSGYTLTNALHEIPFEIDMGNFIRWVNRDPQRNEAYKEAKAIRTEAWAGKIIEHATATDSMEDVQRSKLIVDTYKWLMGADNRRTYGDVKQVELGGSISITAALAQANQRVIEAEVIELLEDNREEN